MRVQYPLLVAAPLGSPQLFALRPRRCQSLSCSLVNNSSMRRLRVFRREEIST